MSSSCQHRGSRLQGASIASRGMYVSSFSTSLHCSLIPMSGKTCSLQGFIYMGAGNPKTGQAGGLP